MTCGIYVFTCLIDGQQYVGESCNIEKRWEEHKNRYSRTNKCPKFYDSLREHGWDNFMFYIIEECSEEKRKEREKFWVAVLNTFLDGLNSNPGGRGVLLHSDSTRKKQSESHKKRFEDPVEREKRSVQLKKYYEDPASREKSSLAGKKRFEDPVEREKSSLASKRRYEDPKEREKTSLAGKKYYEDPAARKKISKPVVGIHLQTGETIWFPSIKEAVRQGYDNVTHCLSGKCKTCKGFSFRYATPEEIEFYTKTPTINIIE